MSQGLLHFHNLMRWVVLIFALVTIFRSLGGMGGGKAFSSGTRKSALFLMISSDIQLLLGLALYFMNNWFQVLTSGGEVMKNPALRFFALEHMAGMLIALTLVHIGYASTKKEASDATKHKRLFWYTLIALIIIIVSIPWPFRELVGRPWFPGMSV